jgi:tetratricopeptide (TPR) repeat protein
MATDEGEDVDPAAATKRPASTLDETLPVASSSVGGRKEGEGRDDYAELVTVSPEHYVQGQEIARGGMGRIRVARDRRLGRTVAVKEILVQTGDAARRFEREARITARLQHPSIVNVHEAGVWPSGEPFYAMKLVSGRSLDDVVAAAGTFEERLALLPSVLAVADAMAYAHGERVIHRDLKPRNVLVGGFGETVVIDWGLAKDLADPSGSAEASGGSFRARSDAAETAVGDVMGTPAYMPPEQAEGRRVDARADVYALGAILDHVLSGTPPYSGASGAEVLDAVKRGPPRPLVERQPGVPPDLLAIVARAMSRDPADRYPTARELAEDLRRYQTGQLVAAHHYSLSQLLRRWLRRHRAVLSVAGVAVIVMLVLGAFAVRRILRAEELAEARRAEADRQRAEADRSRGEAEDLLGFMLGDLREKLQPLGRLDVLDDVSKRAVAYYDGRGDDLSGKELLKRLRARDNLGDVLARQGHVAAALAEYRGSLAIAESRAAKNPGDVDLQREVSVGHEKVGKILFAQGDTTGALAAHRTSLAIRQALAAKDPANTERQRDLSVSYNDLGDVLLARGDAAAALEAYRADLAIAETLAAKDPTDADLQRDLSVSYNNVGNVVLGQGDAAGALTAYRASLAIREALAAKDPTNADRQADLAVSQSNVGDVLLEQEDAAGALVRFRASLVIFDTLAANDPTNADRQRELSVSYNDVGHVMLAQGNAAGALASYRASVAIRETLAAKDPTSADRQWDLAVGHDNVGDALAARGDAAGARSSYLAALAIVQRLQAKDPSSADFSSAADELAGKIAK